MNLENTIEAQRKRMEQEKKKPDMLMKKAKMKQRKVDNHRKIVVGANFEIFLTEPRRYSEEQIQRKSNTERNSCTFLHLEKEIYGTDRKADSGQRAVFTYQKENRKNYL